MRFTLVGMETSAAAPARDDRRSLGAMGERLVARYFEQRGTVVLDRNWRCADGELDLVVREAGGVVVAVEVKSRRGLGFGAPVEAVTWRKQARLRRLLAAWLREHPQQSATALRLDVVGVLVLPGRPVQLRHVTGVGS